MSTNIDYNKINPGVRKLVKFLNDLGYETVDSGDGVTCDYECDPGFPYVTIRVDPDELIKCARNIQYVLEKIGAKIEIQDETGEAPSIEAIYNPQWGDVAYVHVFNIVDDMLDFSPENMPLFLLEGDLK